MKKPTFKDLLWEYLYFGEGYNRIDDCSVKVLNLKPRKNFARCDVEVHYYDPSHHMERTDDVEIAYCELDEFHNLKPGTAKNRA